MQVSIHEAKTHLSKLIKKVLGGEKIIIAKGSVPVAELVPFQSESSRRILGDWKGKIEIAPDFDEPLDDFEEYS